MTGTRGATGKSRRAIWIACRTSATWLRVAVLSFDVYFLKRQVTDHRGRAVVSMTSTGKRISLCHISLASIARGRARPSRLILWLDDSAALANLPRGLRRLQRRGLEINSSSNFGPHTKYFPYVMSWTGEGLDLVTADDDVIYPRWWLEQMLKARATDAHSVLAYRARRMRLSETGFVAYADWQMSSSASPSMLNFATGHSGVMYPASMQLELRSRGSAFTEVCPRADDVWLNYVAFKSGHGVALVLSESRQFWTVSATQRDALKHSNVEGLANDVQLRATYDEGDLGELKRIEAREGAER